MADVLPEFNPFKYNSFPVNGARQSYRLTDALQAQIQRLARAGQLGGLPPVLTFQSVIDFTVSTPAILTALYDYPMDRTLRIKQGFVWLWLSTIGPGNTRALDKYTVEFRLKAPSASFIASLCRLYIVNKKLLLANKATGSYGEFGDYGVVWLNAGNDAGSGAYKLKSWEPRGTAVLTRNVDYWRGWQGSNHVDDLRIVVILEEATAKTMLMKGEIDLDDGWNSPTFYQQLQGVPGVVVERRPWVQLQIVSFNTKKPPYDDDHGAQRRQGQVGVLPVWP